MIHSVESEIIGGLANSNRSVSTMHARYIFEIETRLRILFTTTLEQNVPRKNTEATQYFRLFFVSWWKNILWLKKIAKAIYFISIYPHTY